MPKKSPKVFYKSEFVILYQGNCLDVLAALPAQSVDMVFADPPYNLSDGGITCHAGRMVSVDKGEWDKPKGIDADYEFAIAWLGACQRVLKDDGTIWVSGTMHKIYTVGFAMQRLGYKLLNEICWFKPNASPNLSCRYFTHSHETLIWAAKSEKSKHKFNYELMKQIAGGKQMRSLWVDINIENEAQDIWVIGTPTKEEKKYGKHPTQKPLALLERVISASTHTGDTVLDPFTGSSTTGVAATRLGRLFIGIDTDENFLELSVRRLKAEEEQLRTKPQLTLKSA